MVWPVGSGQGEQLERGGAEWGLDAYCTSVRQSAIRTPVTRRLAPGQEYPLDPDTLHHSSMLMGRRSPPPHVRSNGIQSELCGWLVMCTSVSFEL